MGRPELAQLGLMLEPADENGRLWIQFTQIGGLRVPLLQPSRDGRRRLMRVEEPVVVAGPDLQDIPIVISESDYRYYVH